jgi:CRP-like cAMP-binding protein
LPNPSLLETGKHVAYHDGTVGTFSCLARLLTLVRVLLKKTKQSAPPLALSHTAQNALFVVLSNSTLDTILKRGVLVQLALREQIYEAEEPIHDVYFPLDCILSVVTRMMDGREIEVGTIGREGTSAFPLLLGASSTANVCYCQVRGRAIKIPADLFRKLAANDPAFRQVLDRYLQAYVNMLGQLAACNRLHTVYERCARWLLMTRDRVDTDAIPLTQEFLAMMLGTDRSGVALAASTFQDAGFITYAHGTIHIRDRPRLEKVACECYKVARDQFDGLLRAVNGDSVKEPKEI